MFNIGDEVEIVDDSQYVITTEGSRGVITRSSSGSHWIVCFSYLASGRYGQIESNEKDSYKIDELCLKLLQTHTKEERVINKINQMLARFDKRKLIPGSNHEPVFL